MNEWCDSIDGECCREMPIAHEQLAMVHSRLAIGWMRTTPLSRPRRQWLTSVVDVSVHACVRGSTTETTEIASQVMRTMECAREIKFTCCVAVDQQPQDITSGHSRSTHRGLNRRAHGNGCHDSAKQAHFVHRPRSSTPRSTTPREPQTALRLHPGTQP
jgi:hypothetical protein